METKDAVLKAIQKEIIQRKEEALAHRIDSIYLGGGTPSILNASELDAILGLMHKNYCLSDDAEITLEANPDDVSRIRLDEWQKLGINRLSLGIQSLDDGLLKWMNRPHNAKDAHQSLELIAASNIRNFSCDLIYGLPQRSDEEWIHDLDTLIGYHVPHLSCYALTVEPKTILHHQVHHTKSVVVSEEDSSRQMLLMLEHLAVHHYEDYEISNFALPGHRSRHNSSYWKGQSYFGFGPAAHSFDGQKRRWNVANNTLYAKSVQENLPCYEEESLSPKDHYNEYIMLQLRRKEGISTRELQTRFPEYFPIAEKIMEEYFTSGHVLKNQDGYFLSPSGKLLCDRISMEAFAE